MKAELWQQVREVLDQAIALPAAVRSAYLDENCADEDMRKEVESLLRSHEQAGSVFLKNPAADVKNVFSDLAGKASRIGRRIGVYQIVEEIGHGGMGEVYRALRADGQYKKEVALKLVRLGLDSPALLERFRHERQILATLDHPNIARLLDGGTTEEGIPYLVMELIEGTPIDQYCERHDLSIPERLQLFLQVCGAVLYAHQRLVIHRDVKPSNILVTAQGVPKLLDFGIAKIVDPSAGEETTALRPMTPEYASPEQIRGEPITTASDVYSLGVVLYRLLTGSSPYAEKTRTPLELAKVICEIEPMRPSAGLMPMQAVDVEVSALKTTRWRPSGSAKLKRALRGDLDNILLKTLRKEPQRRYASVEQLAEDIRRHLHGLPVTATPDSIPYRVNKLIRRHRIGMAASALVLVALIGGIATTLREARIAQAERARAEKRFNDVRQLSDSLIFDVNDAIQNLPGATPARKLLLDRAVQYLDNVAKDAAGYPELERELANGYRRLAAVQGDPTQSNLGEAQAAETSVRKALALFEEVARTNPGNISDQLNVAAMHRVLSYSSLMEPAGRRELEQATVIGERLMRVDGSDPNVRSERSVEYQNLGMMQDGLGDRVQAVESLRKDLDLKLAILKANPEFPRVRLHVAVASVLLGSELTKTGSQKDALQTIESGLSFFASMHTGASDLDLAPREALAQMKRGDVQLMDGNLSGARESFHQARLLLEPMAQSDPQNSMLQLDMAGVEYEEGRLLAITGRQRQAVTLLERSREIFERLHAQDRDLDETPHDLAAIYIWLAEAETGTGDLRRALESYQKAADVLQASAGKTMHDDSRCELITALAKIGNTLVIMGDLEQASSSLHKALDFMQLSAAIEKNDVPALYAFADVYAGLGDVAAAKAQQSRNAALRSNLRNEARSWYQASLRTWKQIPKRSSLSPIGFLVSGPHPIARTASASSY
jgi:non-specific serine/threonine protein kinase/serine/threonine-protein kinase